MLKHNKDVCPTWMRSISSKGEKRQLPSRHSASHWLDVLGGWRPWVISLPLHNLGIPILHDVVINNSEDEWITVEAYSRLRTGVIEFIIGKSFYDRGYFLDAFKELSIMNNFELEHIKTDSWRVTARCRPKNYRSCVDAYIKKGYPKVSESWKFITKKHLISRVHGKIISK